MSKPNFTKDEQVKYIGTFPVRKENVYKITKVYDGYETIWYDIEMVKGDMSKNFYYRIDSCEETDLIKAV